jgi:hypothetical protein
LPMTGYLLLIVRSITGLKLKRVCLVPVRDCDGSNRMGD